MYKKLFLALALIVTGAGACHAQRITDVSALDPNNVVLFNTRPISDFTPSQGPWNYVINVPQNVALFSFSISAPAHTDTMNIQAACSYDSSTTDVQLVTFNPAFLAMVGTSNGATVSGNGAVGITLVSSQVDHVVIGINDCQRLLIVFSGAAGTITDTIRAQGAFTPVQSSPFSFGTTATVSGNVTVVGPAASGSAVSGNPILVAGKDNNGNAQDLTVATNGIIQLGQDVGVSVNGNIHTIQAQNQSGVSGVFQVLDSLLNTAGNAVNASVEAGVTGVRAVGGAAAADSAAAGNPVLVGGVDAAGNVQELPVADAGTTAPIQVAQVGGTDTAGNIRAIRTGTLGESFIGVVDVSGIDGVANNNNFVDIKGTGTFALLPQGSFLFNGTTWDRSFHCPATKFVTGITATTAQIVAAVAAQKIRVCSVTIERNDVTGVATTLKLVEGTGANCATGQTSLTGNLFSSGTTAVTTDSPPVAITLGADSAFITNVAADALCVQTTGAASSFDVTITEAQY